MICLAFRKAKGFLVLPVFMQLWLLPAWILLGVARLLVISLPFRTIAAYLGEDRGTASGVPLLTQQQLSTALAVGRTVRLAARYAPWTANCFPQAIVAAMMLRIHNIPYSIFFGLRKDKQPLAKLEAHAWTTSGRVSVTGGFSFGNFTVVGVFTRWG